MLPLILLVVVHVSTTQPFNTRSGKNKHKSSSRMLLVSKIGQYATLRGCVAKCYIYQASNTRKDQITLREMPRPNTSVDVNRVTNHRLVNMLSSTPSSARCCRSDGQCRLSSLSSEKKHRSSRSKPWHHSPCTYTHTKIDFTLLELHCTPT